MIPGGTRSRAGAPAALAGLKVLVVDDEPDVLRGLTLLVGTLGCEVRSAPDAQAALGTFDGWGPHVVLSDINMARMSGLELLDAVHRRQQATRVILITGFGTIELAVAALQRGAAHFITKPFDNEEVLDAVRRYGREALLEARVRRLAPVPGPGAEPVIVAESASMRAALELIDQVAPTRLSVLIHGESGTGKELVARAIHDRSASRGKPFLAVNTAALPDPLLESELFGHRKGAFTGADRDRRGIFERAAGGTVFLDEVGLMSPAFQGKLLRVLEEKTIIPLGSADPRAVDFRVVAASSQDLRERVKRNAFREDLFYRLCVVTIALPPLRERSADIPLLAAHFLARYGPALGAPRPRMSASALQELRRHNWPGNVRELENAIQRALLLARGKEVRAHHLGLGDDPSPAPGGGAGGVSYEEGKRRAVEHFQRVFIERQLAHSAGNVTRAAEACGLTRAAFQRIMRALGLDRADFASGPRPG